MVDFLIINQEIISSENRIVFYHAILAYLTELTKTTRQNVGKRMRIQRHLLQKFLNNSNMQQEDTHVFNLTSLWRKLYKHQRWYRIQKYTVDEALVEPQQLSGILLTNITQVKSFSNNVIIS